MFDIKVLCVTGPSHWEQRTLPPTVQGRVTRQADKSTAKWVVLLTVLYADCPGFGQFVTFTTLVLQTFYNVSFPTKIQQQNSNEKKLQLTSCFQAAISELFSDIKELFSNGHSKTVFKHERSAFKEPLQYCFQTWENKHHHQWKTSGTKLFQNSHYLFKTARVPTLLSPVVCSLQLLWGSGVTKWAKMSYSNIPEKGRWGKRVEAGVEGEGEGGGGDCGTLEVSKLYHPSQFPGLFWPCYYQKLLLLLLWSISRA